MKPRIFRYFRAVLAGLFLIWQAYGQSEGPVRVDPANPHYFNYRGKPIVLLTSDHTYFAVTASDFDYVKFLDTLAAHGSNFTRIYPGAHPVNYTNQPRIFPWVKQANGKYDLDAWNPAYFRRLHGFMQYAQAKGIIVDICFFNGFGSDEKKSYQWRWEWSPLNDANNVQEGVGTKRDYFCTLQEPALVRYEKAYARKLVSELNRYDNLIYDLSDEPDLFNTIDDAKVNPWVSAMMDEVIATEARLPKKHLLAQSFYRSLEDHGKKWGADQRTSWISVEYTVGLEMFDKEYAYNKPYVLIETITPVLNPLGFWKEAYGADASRVHSWAFMLAGGAGFMEFNDDFDSEAPAGRAVTRTILQQRKVLRDFMERLNYERMYRFTDFGGVGKSPSRDDKTGLAWATAIAETGKQYALYVSHSYSGKLKVNGPGYYAPVPGSYEDSITLQNVPAGRYRIDWVNPSDGVVVRTVAVQHPAGGLVLRTPKYAIDIAARVRVVAP